jgi:NAD(P)-dependent dehydrogenase (short-subunit alcohol dehydrogenase family)
MNYLVTGGTGLIGRYTIENLLKRGGTVHALVRPSSKHKLDKLREVLRADEDRLIFLSGDLTQKNLGVSKEDFNRLRGKIDHLYHLGAVYDITASAEEMKAANIDGTREVVAAAETLEVKCLQYTSSLAVAGLYPGVFSEDMFEEAVNVDANPYFWSKHHAEKVVRDNCKIPYRIYRPSAVLGHSKTGEIDKVDGLYFLFKPIQKLRDLLPRWIPYPSIEGPRFNAIPVDYVADAMDYIAHQDGLDGRCFHLTHPDPEPIHDIVNLMMEAARGPRKSFRVDRGIFKLIPKSLTDKAKNLPFIERFFDNLLDSLHIPHELLVAADYDMQFDCKATLDVLDGSGIKVPKLEDYAYRLWDYWERNLDPALAIDQSLAGNVAGKTILVTGASTGIGYAAARLFACAGAKVLLVARNEAKLKLVCSEIHAAGGEARYYPCDLNDLPACDRLIEKILTENDSVDILINNAGRSIRRSLQVSCEGDRFHDFERTMQLNYFTPVRLVFRLLPSMLSQGGGHIINISTIGSLVGVAPKYAGYVASKSALDVWSRSAAAEFLDNNISFTNVHMPMVKTPMLGPTKLYSQLPGGLSPEQAADLIAEAVIRRPLEVKTGKGGLFRFVNIYMPKVLLTIAAVIHKTFPDSSAALGKRTEPGPTPALSQAQITMAEITRGTHI